MSRRRRTTIKWGGLGLCATFFIVWFTSRWIGLFWLFGTGRTHCRVDCTGGRLILEVSGRPGLQWGPLWNGGLSLMLAPRGARHWFWVFDFNHDTSSTSTLTYLEVPFWIPFLLIAVPTTHAVVRERRIKRLNLCPHCSYPLSGLPPDSPCPECGKSPAP